MLSIICNEGKEKRKKRRVAVEGKTNAHIEFQYIYILGLLTIKRSNNVSLMNKDPKSKYQ
jgi:hypothetical protein